MGIRGHQWTSRLLAAGGYELNEISSFSTPDMSTISLCNI